MQVIRGINITKEISYVDRLNIISTAIRFHADNQISNVLAYIEDLKSRPV